MYPLILIKNTDPDLEETMKKYRIKIGRDVVLGEACYFGEAVTVGNNVVFSGDDKIGGHTVIESGVRIGFHCKIGEGSYIGKDVILGDNVSLPKRTYVSMDRGIIDRSEEFTAVFSSAGKVESFFGSDRILLYDPEIGQDYETSMSFKEFILKAKVRQRLRIKQEEKRGEFIKKVSSLIGVLKILENKKD
jgi:NDP-sugar pyrophosphorylase family protein